MSDWADEFSGRKVVLTGACGVFGHWIAAAFAKAGARLCLSDMRAPFLVARGFAKQMIATQVKGNIVNISSGAARRMRRTVVPYCTSKTALDRLTKGLALELAAFGIRVNAVEPGFAPGSTASPLTAAHVDGTIAGIPMQRASSPDDASHAIM